MRHVTFLPAAQEHSLERSERREDHVEYEGDDPGMGIPLLPDDAQSESGLQQRLGVLGRVFDRESELVGHLTSCESKNKHEIRHENAI